MKISHNKNKASSPEESLKAANKVDVSMPAWKCTHGVMKSVTDEGSTAANCSVCASTISK